MAYSAAASGGPKWASSIHPAALLVAFYPNIWRYDGMLLSETMVIFVVLITLWAAVFVIYLY